MVWEVDKFIHLVVHKLLVFHLRDYLEEKGISPLVYVWLLILALGGLNISL